MAHAYLAGWTEIGEDNSIHMGAVIGHEPQDREYKGGKTYLRIGHRNIIREHVQIHRGTKPESSTIIGNENFFMNHAHIAHNCEVGDGVVIAGGALLAGYVQVGNGAFISGNCVVHQFVRIGKLAMLRGLSRTSRDVPPFCIMDDTHTVKAINQVGLVNGQVTAREKYGRSKRLLPNFFAAKAISPRRSKTWKVETRCPKK